MQNIIEVIQKRTSIRTYSKEPIEQSQRAALEAYLQTATENPFGAHVRLALVDSEGAPERLGTYGFIRGAKTYVAGCVKRGGRDLEGFGFAFEQAVLFATQLGLGTCWLGGTLRRGAFEKALNVTDEMLPAASPVGYAAVRRSLTERIVAAGAGARKRLDSDAMFFDDKYGTPITVRDERIRTCLEMVRIGASASNKQPWRVIHADEKYHFYMAKNSGYAGNTVLGFSIQRIDMGIAACHFMLSAKELGLCGDISFDDPGLLTAVQENAGITYSFSWG